MKSEYVLTSGEIDGCLRFAKKVAETYATGAKAASGSLTVDGETRNKRERAFWLARSAEFGVCRLLGLDPIVSLNWDLLIDDGYDLVYRDRFIDVKSSRTLNPRLVFPKSKAHWVTECDVDFFCLAQIEPPRVRVVGFVSIADFLARKRTSAGSDGFIPGTLWMPAGELTSLGEFVSSLA